MRTVHNLGVVGVCLLTLAACQQGEEPVTAESTVTEVATVTATATAIETVEAEAPVVRRPIAYADVEQLLQAASEVGLECQGPQDLELLNFTSAVGCEQGLVAGVWSDRQQMGTDLPMMGVTIQQLATEQSIDLVAILGQNWVVFGAGASSLPEDMGGVRIDYSADGDAQDMVPSSAQVQSEAEDDGPQDTISEGSWTVGRDIKPGTYTTIETVGDSCYWKISTSGSNGDDIIANDIVTGGRPTVTLSEGHDFQTSRCGTWQQE